MTSRRIYLAAVVIAFVAGIGIGGWATPTRTVESVSVQRATRVEYRERTQSATATRTNEIAVVGPTLVRTRWVACPKGEGQVVEQTVERGTVETRKEAVAAQHVTVSKDRLLTATEATLAVRAVERQAPRWGFGVGGALRFWDAAVLVTGSVELRALGPFHVQAFAMKAVQQASDFTAGLQLVLRVP